MTDHEALDILRAQGHAAARSPLLPEFDEHISRSQDFRSKLREAVSKSGDARDFSESGWQKFENRIHYIVGDINDQQFYSHLRSQSGGDGARRIERLR